jgi:hypothetical protein
MWLGMTRGELLFLSMILALIFGWAWLPRAGERLGAMLDRK